MGRINIASIWGPSGSQGYPLPPQKQYHTKVAFPSNCRQFHTLSQTWGSLKNNSLQLQIIVKCSWNGKFLLWKRAFCHLLRMYAFCRPPSPLYASVCIFMTPPSPLLRTYLKNVPAASEAESFNLCNSKRWSFSVKMKIGWLFLEESGVLNCYCNACTYHSLTNSTFLKTRQKGVQSNSGPKCLFVFVWWHCEEAIELKGWSRRTTTGYSALSVVNSGGPL